MDDAARLVKEKIDIVDYIGRSVTLKKSGRNFSGLCPFHSEHTPSFNVSPDRQIFKCFGCGVSGDLFTFVMQSEGVTFLEALQLLAGEAGIPLDQFHHKSASEKSVEDRYYAMHELAAAYYHYLLMKHAVGQEARDFFTRRGIDLEKDVDLVTRFQLGYAPRSWDSLGNYLLKKGYSSQDIVDCGLGVKSENKRGFYDMFRGRAMFPLFDKNGRVVGFAGRVLGSDKTAKYINTSETKIFHKREFLFGFFQAKESIRRKGEAILVEGEMDMISSYKIGVKHVVAVKGSTLTEEQITLLGRVCSRLLLCFDADSAGDAAMRKAVTLAESKGFEIKVIRPLVGKDADECIQKGASFWLDSIAQAVPYYDSLIQSALQRYDVKSAYGQRAIIHELRPHISAIKDIVLRTHYIQKLGTLIDFPEKQLEKLFMYAQPHNTMTSYSAPQTPVRNTSTQQELFYERIHRMERYILSLILRMERPVEGVTKKLQIDDIDDKSVKVVYTLYADFFNSHPERLVKDFLQFVTDTEVLSVIDDVFLIDVPFENDNELKRELYVSIKQVKELLLREKLRLLSMEIRQAELSGNTAVSLDKLQKEMQSLHDRLGRLQRVD